MNEQINNPILGGFYPDPSICRVGEDFYMITSTFEMFPGLPVFHSKDLVHWEQLCYACDRPSQLYLSANVIAGGVMAPTIRYYDGLFYIINANFCDAGNFIVTAKDPAGPWSEPYWLPDVQGIDASLFFDDDGKAYVLGLGNGPDNKRGVYICEFDIHAMKTIGEKNFIWNSALRNAASPEAPHIYKKNGYYYLVIAEGGTEHYHAVTVARSRELFGWYEGNPGNPIMTHRHLGWMYPICNTGHADLVELESGEWYAVMLASRLIEGYHKNLGRETYIVPVIWEKDWPIMSPGTGRIEWSYPAPELPWTPYEPLPVRDDFDGKQLALPWNFWGTPFMDFWKLEDSRLKLKLLPRPVVRAVKPINLRQRPDKVYNDNVSLVGRRQCHVHFTFTAKMEFIPQTEKEVAGILVMQASNHQFRFERAMENGKQIVRLIKVTSDINGAPHMPDYYCHTDEQVLASAEYVGYMVCLKITALGQAHSFYFGSSEENMQCLYANADGREINPEVVGGMVGTYLAMFATANETESDNWAAFDWCDYDGNDA